jgi:hypothetical protein
MSHSNLSKDYIRSNERRDVRCTSNIRREGSDHHSRLEMRDREEVLRAGKI